MLSISLNNIHMQNTHTHTNTHTCADTHTHTRAHAQTDTPTHTHTHTHTHIPISPLHSQNLWLHAPITLISAPGVRSQKASPSWGAPLKCFPLLRFLRSSETQSSQCLCSTHNSITEHTCAHTHLHTHTHTERETRKMLSTDHTICTHT